MAFEASDLFCWLEDGLLHKSLVLFGDNAYLNSHFMVTPYPNVSIGSKDDYILAKLSEYTHFSKATFH